MSDADADGGLVIREAAGVLDMLPGKLDTSLVSQSKSSGEFRAGF